MNISYKGFWIGLGVALGVVFAFTAAVILASNTAIGYEEAISDARAGIQIQEKREYDLITKMVQVAQADSKFEAETLKAIVAARNTARAGNVSGAVTAINALAEQYPTLKSTEAYTQIMTELSVSENLKAAYRNTYNDTIQEYRTHVRRFPNSFFLFLANYEVKTFDYLQFHETDLPDQLFPNP